PPLASIQLWLHLRAAPRRLGRCLASATDAFAALRKPEVASVTATTSVSTGDPTTDCIEPTPRSTSLYRLRLGLGALGRHAIIACGGRVRSAKEPPDNCPGARGAEVVKLCHRRLR